MKPDALIGVSKIRTNSFSLTEPHFQACQKLLRQLLKWLIIVNNVRSVVQIAIQVTVNLSQME